MHLSAAGTAEVSRLIPEKLKEAFHDGSGIAERLSETFVQETRCLYSVQHSNVQEKYLFAPIP
jgi:hypothetical protein